MVLIVNYFPFVGGLWLATAGWMAMAGSLAGGLADWLAHWLVGWPVGWLSCCEVAGWLAGWLALAG